MGITNTSDLPIQVVAKGKYFKEYRDALARALSSLGFSTSAREKPDYSLAPRGVLVIGPHLYRRHRFSHFGTVIHGAIQTEQFPSMSAGALRFGDHRFRRFRSYAKTYDFILDWHRSTRDMLAERYPNVFHMPHGSYAAITHSPVEDKPETYDLAFIGDPTGIDSRRERILIELSAHYSIHPTFSGVWGDKKAAVLHGSRIILNLHFDEALTFESPRFYECLSSGCFLLSEPVADPYPFVPGRDYAECFTHQLRRTIDFYLENESERTHISFNGQQTAQEFSIDRSAVLVAHRFLVEKGLRRDPRYRRRNTLYHRFGWPSYKDPTR